MILILFTFILNIERFNYFQIQNITALNCDQTTQTEMGIFNKLFRKKEMNPQVPNTENLMEEDKFWHIIQITKENAGGDYEEQQFQLQKELLKLSPTEIIEFDNRFRIMRGDLYHWDLWAAAYIINGGCSDDCFSDFRGWLIAQGKEVVSNTLQNPEFLAVLESTNDGDWEGFSYVMPEAFKQKTGNEIPRGIQENLEISGDEWDEDGNELQAKFPKLWERYN